MFKRIRKDQEANRSNNPKVMLVKEWVLFLGELVKASVEGVVEFWSPADQGETVAQLPEEEQVDAAEELLDETVEEIEEIVEDVETSEIDAAQERACAKELRLQAKKIKKMAKRAKREENRIKRSEKKLEKQAKKAVKAEKKQAKKQAKQVKQQEKKEKQVKQKKTKKKSDYVSKSVILSETEKRFYDGIKSAVGLRYIVKPRVELAGVLKRGDGTKCKDEQLGEMDFGIFDLQHRLKVFVEIKGLKRRGKQSQKTYKKVRKLCKKAGIPVVTFWAKYGVLPEYIKERMRDYLNL